MYRPPQPEVQGRRYLYIALCIVGFTISDLFYIAAVINYALQCQLITFLVNVNVERIRNKCLTVDSIIKVLCVQHIVHSWYSFIILTGNQSHSGLFEGVKWTSCITNVTPVICTNSDKHFLWVKVLCNFNTLKWSSYTKTVKYLKQMQSHARRPGLKNTIQGCAEENFLGFLL